MKKLFFVLLLSVIAAQAQLVQPQSIPNTGKPPVVFLNGYQQDCNGTTFSGSFGMADQVLQQEGRPTVFFNNCSFGNRSSIETLGNAFGTFLESLRYQDGSPVRQLDAVGHSLGGLIIRSYLAGKQPDGTYRPPSDTRIRKLVFLATPHAGTDLATLLGGSDAQLDELATGSRFLFELATWNQNTEDLRGIDALSLLGNAGNGRIGGTRFTDSTVSLTSGSIEQWLPGRTRILADYCHISGGLAALVCTPSDKGIAEVTSSTQDNARALVSFLADTEAWRSIGVPAAQNELLASTAGVLVQWRDANDRMLNVLTASSSEAGTLQIRSEATAYRDRLSAKPQSISALLSGNQNSSTTVEPVAAGTSYYVLKPGPYIAAAFPSAQAVTPRAVAPGMFVSIYGSQLATATAQASELPYPTTLGGTQVRIGERALPLHYASASQVNAVIPDDVSGLVRLTVANAGGQNTFNVVVEGAVPALFAPAINATTGTLVNDATPLRPGDYVSLYLTGLGATEKRGDGLDWARQQPEVTVGGKACMVSYAGRAPGYVGLDQINCLVDKELPASMRTQVTVRSGTRVTSSNLPVR